MEKNSGASSLVKLLFIVKKYRKSFLNGKLEQNRVNLNKTAFFLPTCLWMSLSLPTNGPYSEDINRVILISIAGPHYGNLTPEANVDLDLHFLSI